MPQKPSSIKQNKIANAAQKQFSPDTYGQNDDAKSGKRCKTNGGQTTDQNDTAKSGKTQRG